MSDRSPLSPEDAFEASDIETPSALEVADPIIETVALIEHGTPEFRRTNLALFAAGFATFALLYCVQPLFPVFTRDFGATPVHASLALSLTTGFLAVSLLFAGSVSEIVGRKPIMVASLFVSAGLTIVSSVAPTWAVFLTIRALEGITLSGLPAVAMAYLGEEIHPRSIGLAMGLYIGGSAFGGMAGRFLSGALSDAIHWRVAIAVIGGLGLLSAIAFWRSLPASLHFEAQARSLRALARSFAGHLRDPAMRLLFAESFLLMGSFVTLYNYAGYRLVAPPYHLSQTAIGAIFLVYLIGTFSSAWVGNLAGRLGRRKVFWATLVIMMAGAALTLAQPLPVIIAGIAVFTFGFFGGHSIASSWVGRRATSAKAQASSLYLFAYYGGSSLVGSAGGLFFTAFAWPGVVGLVVALLLIALAGAIALARLPALAPPDRLS
nr:MFS transporter [Segnochrobactrum spirostomi]